MRHRQRRQKRAASPDRHVCCRHAGRPMLTARRWVWLMSVIAGALCVGYTYLDVAVPAMRRWVDCNTPGVTCHSYYDFERPPQPAVPSSLGGSL